MTSETKVEVSTSTANHKEHPGVNTKEPYLPQIDLDRESSEPLYMQVYRPLARLINAGALAPGQLVEDEISMAARLQVSRPTVRRAFSDLVNEGLLVRRRGSGTRVSHNPIKERIGLRSLNEELKALGYETKTDVLEYQVLLADESIAGKLHCELNDEVVSLKRLRWADGEPLTIMNTLIQQKFAPTLTDLTKKGLYECYRDEGIEPKSAIQSLSAKNATESEAKLLDIATGDALFVMKRTTFDAEREIIEFAHHLCQASRYEMTVQLSAE